MAYRVPRFSWLHALRVAGASAISASTGTFDSDGQLEYLIDGRRSLAKLTGTDVAIDVDRGAGPDAVDRLVILPGHNLNGETITLEADTVSNFASATTLLSSVSISSAGIIDEDFTSNSEQYMRLIVESFTGTAEIPQLFITETQTPTIGPNPFWPDTPTPNLLHFQKHNRDDAVLQLAADQRIIEHDYRAATGADLTLLDALIAHANTGQRFLFDPTFDDEDPLWVALEGVAPVAWDFPDPSVGTKSKRYRLTMREIIA